MITIDTNNKTTKKMLFLYNAIENGWTIYKKGNLYSFKKKHEGKQKYFDEDFLARFTEENCDIENLLNELM